MQIGDSKLLVVGDRVLLRASDGESVTKAGLILPESVADQDNVQTGRVVAVGPGFATSSSHVSFDEDWEGGPSEPRYIAMQARVGDLAVYHRKTAVEINVKGESMVVVPHAGILVLLRDQINMDSSESRVN